MGIGCRRDPLEANVWYVRAADHGDERAKQRLQVIRAAEMAGIDTQGIGKPKRKKVGAGAAASGTPAASTTSLPQAGVQGEKNAEKNGDKDDKECTVM